MSDRRHFLTGMGLAAATFGLAPGALLAGASLESKNPAVTRGQGIEAFLTRLNQRFSFVEPHTGRQQWMELVAVEPGPAAPRLDQFSLTFRRDSGSAPGNAIYWVSDEAGEGRAVYAEPASGDGRSNLLRADFCLIRRA